MSTEGIKSIVEEAMEPLNQLEVPDRLNSLIDRHHQNLMNLARCLLQGGRADHEVRKAIKLVCSSFESELFNTLNAIADSEEFNVR